MLKKRYNAFSLPAKTWSRRPRTWKTAVSDSKPRYAPRNHRRRSSAEFICEISACNSRQCRGHQTKFPEGYVLPMKFIFGLSILLSCSALADAQYSVLNNTTTGPYASGSVTLAGLNPFRHDQLRNGYKYHLQCQFWRRKYSDAYFVSKRRDSAITFSDLGIDDLWRNGRRRARLRYDF